MTNPSRPFTIICGVIHEALRSSGRHGVVLCGGGPEEALLAGWMEQAGIPVVSPSPPALETAFDLRTLCGPGNPTTPSAEPEGSRRRDAQVLAGWAFSSSRGLLLLGAANKTQLLLSPVPPLPTVLPLGDLYASEVRELAGGCTLPPVLEGCGEGEVLAVDRALEAYFGDGLPEADAFHDLGAGLRTMVPASLEEARKGWRAGPLIPKLGRATLGLDLDP